MNTCDTWEFNSAKAKAMRLKAEAHRWDARVCELLGDSQGALDNRTVSEALETSARGYDKWAREAPDAPKAEEPATDLKAGTCKVDCGCVSYCRAGLEPTPKPQAALLTNPYTGTPRDYRDVESDPAGVLIQEPGAPLRAAAPQPQAVPTLHMVCDSPHQREAMARHLESIAAAMRRGAVVVTGGLHTMGPLHLAGDVQLAEAGVMR